METLNKIEIGVVLSLLSVRISMVVIISVFVDILFGLREAFSDLLGVFFSQYVIIPAIHGLSLIARGFEVFRW